MVTGRAFVAVVPPEAVLEALAGLGQACAAATAGGRWARRDQQHLTLQFLGNGVDLGATASALADLRVEAGTVGLGGLGAFPSSRRARVLWAGVASGAAWLAVAAGAVADALVPTGLIVEDRAYRPHVTLARFGAPTDVRALVGGLGAGSIGPPWSVAEVVLLESRTARAGAAYRAVARVATIPADGP